MLALVIISLDLTGAEDIIEIAGSVPRYQLRYACIRILKLTGMSTRY